MFELSLLEIDQHFCISKLSNQKIKFDIDYGDHRYKSLTDILETYAGHSVRWYIEKGAQKKIIKTSIKEKEKERERERKKKKKLVGKQVKCRNLVYLVNITITYKIIKRI